MKKLLIFSMALFTTVAFAQNNNVAAKKKQRTNRLMEMSPEDMANLRVKKMTLNLDLTEEQRDKIYPLILEQTKKFKEDMATKKAQKEEGEKRKKLSSKEKLERTNAQLDEKIAFKAKMKEILNEEQYKKFERSQAKRGKQRHKAVAKRRH